LVSRGERWMMDAPIRVLYVDDEPSLLTLGKIFCEKKWVVPG
jgi:hypothetical protein